MELSQYVNMMGWCDPKPEFIAERLDTVELRQWRDPQPYWFSWFGVYHCVSVEEGYLILTNGFKYFRAKPEAFTPIQPASYKWGDIVYIRKKLDRPRRVVDVGYHRQNKVIVYRVESSDAFGVAYWFDYQLIAAKEVDFD
ncbi:MAG: hypothetical protein F9K46_14165 [Anaerolineae bacterium]|nr:MAG: hypothetical protein F9K46_14165 [Anaerolineae bacterium]